MSVEIRHYLWMLSVMAVAREEISYGKFLAIFRESDEETMKL